MFECSVPASDPAVLSAILKKAGNEKPLAKSLHTVTVLVNLARYLESQEGRAPWNAVFGAAEILGLGDMPDNYGLLQQAHKKLRK